MNRHLLRLLVSTFLFAATLGTLRADDDPAPALESAIRDVIELAVGRTPAERVTLLPAIRDRFTPVFAYDALVQRAFGRNWTKLTPAQQAEARDLLVRLILRTYVSQLRSGEKPTVAVAASRLIVGTDRREIESTVTLAGNRVNVLYRLARFDGAWKIYDVLAEGVSIVGNYRRQFDAHFERKDAATLLDLLRERLAAPLES